MKSIRVRDEVTELVEGLRALGHPYSLLGSQGAVIEYALMGALEESKRPVSRSQIDELITAYRDGILDKMASSTQIAPEEPRRAGRPRKESTALVSNATDNDGIAICSVLGGTIANGSCQYKKRELTPTGKAVEFEVGIPLDRLSQMEIDNQYEPSREVWEARKVEQEKESVPE